MNLQLMREFEEFEGLGSQIVDDTADTMENEDDDATFRPAQAASLTSNDIYYEVSVFIIYIKKILSNFCFLSCLSSWINEASKQQDFQTQIANCCKKFLMKSFKMILKICVRKEKKNKEKQHSNLDYNDDEC